MKLFAAIILLSLSQAQILGLPEEQIELSQALLMERAGNIEGAQKIYTRILKTDPRNQRAYQQLKSILKRLGENSQGIELMENWLEINPHDLHSMLDLGETLYNNNQTARALEIWLNYEQNYLSNPTTFRMIFHVYARFALIENMLRVQRLARTSFSKPDFLALELGNYYQLRQSYDLALESYLLAARHENGKIKIILDRILLMSDDESALEIIESSLLNQPDSDSVLIQEILSAYYFKTGDFEKSYIQHKNLGLKTNADYERLLNFSENLREEKQYDLALQAYHYILQSIDQKDKAVLINRALLGLGQTYETQIVQEHNTLEFVAYFPNNIFFEDVFYRKLQVSDLSLNATLDHYRSILKNASKSNSNARVHFRLGEIQYRIIKDFSGARQSFKAALDSRPSRSLKNKIILRLGDLYLAEGKLEETRTYFQKLMQTPGSNQIDLISLKYLQALLLSGEIEKTADMLESLFIDITPQHRFFNDLFELQDLIINNYLEASDQDRQAFENYLRAEIFIRRNMLPQALEIFSYNKINFAGASINPFATLREALLRLRAGDTSGALKISLSLEKTILKDKGLVLSGEISEIYLNDVEQALVHYNRVLQECSMSPMTEPIRLHIRKLKALES